MSTHQDVETALVALKSAVTSKVATLTAQATALAVEKQALTTELAQAAADRDAVVKELTDLQASLVDPVAAAPDVAVLKPIA